MASQVVHVVDDDADVRQSLAFLLSGLLAVLVVGLWSPKSVAWQASWINMMGCVAFQISALAAFVRKTGVTVDERLANFGTFVGALCFLAAALLVRPKDNPEKSRLA